MFFTLRVSSARRGGYAQPSVGYILLTTISFHILFSALCAHSITGGIMVNRRVKCKYC